MSSLSGDTAELAWLARTAQRADEAAFAAVSGTVPPRVTADGNTAVTDHREDTPFDDREQAQAWLEAKHLTLVDAVRAAAARELHDLVMALAVACRFLTSRGQEWTELHVEVTGLGVSSAAAAGADAVEALLLSMRLSSHCRLGQWDQAEADAARCLAIAVRLDDPARKVSGLTGLGHVLRGRGRLEEAAEYFEQSAAIARDSDQPRSVAVALCHLSKISMARGDFEAALNYAQQQLRLRQQAGDRIGEAGALCDAALAWQSLDRHEKAVSLLRPAIESYLSLGYVGVDAVEAVSAIAISLTHAPDTTDTVELARTAAARLDSRDPRVPEARQRLAMIA